MEFKPLDRMWERIEIARGDSETALFGDLMLLGEMITKIIVAGLASAVTDDQDRNRYRTCLQLF